MASALGRGSLPLFAFKGIKVGLHWSFIALPAYIIFTSLGDGQSWSVIGTELAMVGIVFVCVVLHEFGHALTAKRYGVGTRDIVLLPIGGVASLERMPEIPKQEFWITLAGPLVNLAIALLAVAVMAVLDLTAVVTNVLLSGSMLDSLLAFVFAANIGLFLFNLVPAFPMDGGRLLRSLLAMRMLREKATRIATTIGRILAVGFIGYAIYRGQPFMAIIGLFIFMAAGAEARQSAQRERLRGITVAQIMRTRFLVLSASTIARTALEELIAGGDTAAIVSDGTMIMGVVDRHGLLDAVKNGRAEVPLAELPPKTGVPAAPGEDAHAVVQRMSEHRLPMLPVVDGEALVGAVDAAKVQELLDVRRAVDPGA
jgi:Zn-dependent protease